ncbi:MAG: mechanosensitive ion channel [Planctomycetes bacterium]|nr:mechanosensitive ion channel [Planctomycetota bacterium]
MRLVSGWLPLAMVAALFAATSIHAQQTETKTEAREAAVTPAENVAVHPNADDASIARRLERILAATPWFAATNVEVHEGVVTLRGTADTAAHREWASALTRNTEDVVAVVNELTIAEEPIFDLAPAWAEARSLLRQGIRALPLILIGALIFVAVFFIAGFTKRIASSFVDRRVESKLLRNVIANTITVPVIVLGVFAGLRVSGLTQLAATVIGGTGLVGLIVGIAFRDIAENFLASILISAQRPFRIGDLIEVGGRKGYVQSVTLRGTLLMTANGNHVQLPNSMVYKSEIENFTANANARHSFVVGIGYDDDAELAQGIALDVLRAHPAVKDDPEPFVLVDGLGESTVDLKAYYWVDIEKNSELKVRSALLRILKDAFVDSGISMPDAAREIVFPSGVPVTMLEGRDSTARPRRDSPTTAGEPTRRPRNVVSAGEGDLDSDAATVEQQASISRSVDDGKNLIEREPSAVPAGPAAHGRDDR